MEMSLRALLTGVIDYAGLFPPASQSLADASAEYLDHRQGRRSWMLGRFVCPLGKLDDLAPLIDRLPANEPTIAFSVLVKPAVDTTHFLVDLLADLVALREFRDGRRGRAVIDVIETSVPNHCLIHDEGDRFWHAQQSVRQSLETAGFEGVSVFYELPSDPEWKLRFPHVVAAIAAPEPKCGSDTISLDADYSEDAFEPKQEIPPGSSQFVHDPAGVRSDRGFKLRTGGLEAKSFPSSAVVANVIAECHRRGIRWKATAGLHHPFPLFDETIGAMMHGFVNLLVADVLAQAGGVSVSDIETILEEKRPERFEFHENRLQWKDQSATIAQIESARQRSLASFGSCSFAEPVADLRAAGLL
jgi:hypothetical protein